MTQGGVHVLALCPSARLCAAELSGARSEFQRPVLIAINKTSVLYYGSPRIELAQDGTGPSKTSHYGS